MTVDETEPTKETELKARYDVTCAACGHAFLAAPCLAMLMGHNSGYASCSRCKEPLHLEIAPDLFGEAMISMRHAEWLSRVRTGQGEA